MQCISNGCAAFNRKKTIACTTTTKSIFKINATWNFWLTTNIGVLASGQHQARQLTIHVWAMCHRSWVPEARDTGSVLTSVLHDLLCVWAQQRCVDSQYFDPLSVPNFLWNLHYILSAPLHIGRSAVQSVGLYRSAVRIAWYIYVLPSQTLTWGTYLLFCCYQTNQQSTIYSTVALYCYT